MDSTHDLSPDFNSQGVSRSGRVRKKSAKFADYFDSTDEPQTASLKKKSPLKSLPKVASEHPESSTSESTSSSSDDSDDSEDDFDEDGAIDLKDGFLEYGNWEEDISNSLNATKDESEDNPLQVDEDAGPHTRRGRSSQNQSNYSSEKKKSIKGPIGQQKKTKGKEKGKTTVTAYMLFAREKRGEITSAFPEMEFSLVNKRLGEMWARMPSAQKFVWKRRAKHLADKEEKTQGSSMISTGKAKGAKGAAALQAKSRGATKGKSHSIGRPPKQTESKVIPYEGLHDLAIKQSFQTPKHSKSNIITDSSPPNIFKVAGTSPIDVAAHLKLLGESLNNIGQKLKEHEGQIAVSGSLSVLLDSMLCVLGPLASLTNQLEETRSAIPEETLNSILDNIAYIMPGIV